MLSTMLHTQFNHLTLTVTPFKKCLILITSLLFLKQEMRKSLFRETTNKKSFQKQRNEYQIILDQTKLLLYQKRDTHAWNLVYSL